MPDYNRKGRPTISKLLSDLRDQIDRLQVSDPRLENLRQMVYELSIRVEEMEARLRALESHESTGLQILKIVSLVVFILVVVYISRLL